MQRRGKHEKSNDWDDKEKIVEITTIEENRYEEGGTERKIHESLKIIV